MAIADKVLQVREDRKKQTHLPVEIRDRVHISSSSSDGLTEEPGNYSEYSKVYSVHSWTQRAISIVSNSVAPLRFGIVDEENHYVESHQLTALFSRVNDQMAPDELWQGWTVDMMLAGESFFEYFPDRRGRPAEIWPRRPNMIKVVPDKALERQYAPRVAGYYYGDDDETLIPPDRVSHTKFYNPRDPFRGLAPIKAVREGLTIDILAQAWSKLFLKRGARPDYALLTPQGLTESERDELETKLAMKLSGSDNWHKPIILETGITDIKTFSFSPKDIEWLEQRRFSRDEIAAIFGVPDELMGFGKDTYQNFRTAYRVFWQLTIMNLVSFRDRFFTHYFTKINPILQEGYKFRTDTASVSALQEEMGPKIDSVLKLWSIGVPFDTLNQRFNLGFDPIPGGDIGYVPYSLIPVGGEHRLPIQVQGRPPEDTTPDELVEPVEPEPSEEMGIVSLITKDTHPWPMFDRMLQKHERLMQMGLKREFQEQQNEALRNARNWDYSVGIEREETKAFPGIKDLLDWGEAIRRIKRTFSLFYRAVYKEFGDLQLKALDPDRKFDLRLVEESLEKLHITFADDIAMTTQKMMSAKIRDILLDAAAENWSMDEIKKAIYDGVSTVFDTRKSDYETWRIAQNEMHKAACNAQLEAMRQAGKENLRKRWISMMDPPRARPGHMTAHVYYERGIPINEPFIVNGIPMMHPGDGPISETAGCRCFTEAVYG